MDVRIKEVLDTAGKYDLELAADSLEFVDMGLDFQVVFAEDGSKQDWVLRLPRRKDVFEKTGLEKNVLDFIATSQNTFEVPFWEIFEEDLIAYQKLENAPAVTTIADTGEENWVFKKEAVPENYVRSFGQSLAALHGISVDQACKTGMTVYTGEEIRISMKSRMDKVNSNFEVSEKLWDKWMCWVENDKIWPEKTAVIHGDLFPGHTLIDSDHHVTGIIDWTEAKVSDPANDFTAFYLLFGEDKLDELIGCYREAGGYIWTGMKTHIIALLDTQAITIAEFAESSGLEEYRKMAEEMLGQK